MQIYAVIPQALSKTDSPTFAGLTVTGNSVFGLNSSVFQPATDSTTFFQVLDADGGTPIFNVDTTNEKVGIGTTTPNAPLEVKGAKPAGNVGGHQSGMLHVTGSGTDEFSNSVITGHSAFNGNTQLWYLGSTTINNDDIAFINRQNAPIHFYTNNTSRMTIDAAGGVHFNGAITTDSTIDGIDIATDVAANTTHRGLTSGNPHSVTPTELSLVIGTNTQAFGAVLDDLNTLGAPASDGQFIVATDAEVFAYESTTTARTSLGVGEADTPTFASLNITDEATGLQVDGANFLRTDANDNVCMGLDAASSDIGFANVFIGSAAGEHNDHVAGQTGRFNVYIAAAAGQGETADTNNTGMYNVGLGVYSLRYNTSGSENMAIGYGTLYSNTSGLYNMAIGKDVLFHNTDGARNVGIGTGALYEISSGDDNVAIGDAAGKGVSGNDFEKNVLIGKSAGSRLTTGGSNIFLGFRAGTRQTTGGNLLIIDNGNRADVATELTNSIIHGTMAAAPANQTLRINASTLVTNKVAFTQTDLDEYIDSLNDGYMDYGATTGHRFNANVDVTGTISTTSDDNWDFNDYTVGSITKTGYLTVTVNGTEYKLIARLEP